MFVIVFYSSLYLQVIWLIKEDDGTWMKRTGSMAVCVHIEVNAYPLLWVLHHRVEIYKDA